MYTPLIHTFLYVEGWCGCSYYIIVCVTYLTFSVSRSLVLVSVAHVRLLWLHIISFSKGKGSLASTHLLYSHLSVLLMPEQQWWNLVEGSQWDFQIIRWLLPSSAQDSSSVIACFYSMLSFIAHFLSYCVIAPLCVCSPTLCACTLSENIYNNVILSAL